MRKLYNGKWEGIWDKPKYVQIREAILGSFKDLTFVEEGHKYYLHGKEITCVSNVTHLYQEKFDAEAQAPLTSQRYWDDPASKYYHKTAEEIIEMWKENSRNACEHGTERHEFGESCFYFMTGQYDKILPAFQDRLALEEDGRYSFTALMPKEEAIVQFYEDIPSCIIPILAETKVYDEELGYSGTFDILFYYEDPNDEKSGLFIMDWKTNEDLFKVFKIWDPVTRTKHDKTLLKPFNGLSDMPLSVYKLQLSLYQNCLEKIGMKVIARRILWLRNNGSYEKIPLESYVTELREDLIEKRLQTA